MTDAGRIACAPSATLETPALLLHTRDHRIGAGQQERAPIRMLGGQQVRRLFGHQPPERALEQRHRSRTRCDTEGAGEHPPHDIPGVVAELPHQSVTDRLRRRTRGPACDPPAQFGTLGLVAHRILIECSE